MKLFLPRRLYARLMVLVLTILVSTIVTYSWFTSERQAELLRRAMIEHATIMAENVSESCAHYLVLSDYAGLDVVVQKTVQLPDIQRIQICEKSGKVLSDALHQPLAEAVPGAVPSLATLNVPGLAQTVIDLENKEEMVVWQPISAGSQLGWLKTTYSMRSVADLQAAIWRNTALLGAAWIVLSFVLFFLALRSPLGAIRQLTVFARRLDESKGEQVSVGNDSLEIRQLEGSLNYASQKLFATEQQLISEQERLAVTLQSIGDGVIAVDRANAVVLINKAAEQMTGWTSREAVGMQLPVVFRVLDEHGSDPLSSHLQQVHDVLTRLELPARSVLIARSGTGRSIANSVSPIIDGEGNFIGVVLVFRDVTEREKAEAALQRSEYNYRTIMEQAAEGISIADLDGNYIDANGRMLEMLGYTRGEYLQLSMKDVIAKEELAATPLKYAELLAGKTVVSERRMLRKDGSTFPAEITGKMLQDGRLYGVTRDITERRRAEAALRESEDRYKHLIESVTDYMVTVKLEQGRPVSTVHGPGCVAVTGYAPGDYGRDGGLWYRMIHQDDRQAVLDQIERITAGARAVPPLEHRITHKDGSVRWVKNATVPRYDAQGTLIAYDCLISDITERKKVEEQLRQAQKMEAIGQLAGGVAHDFNNILTAIMGYGHILHMKMKKDDPQRMNVEHLLESVDRAVHLTHSLLAFSRKQIITLANVDLTEIIRRVEKFLRRIIGEDIELRTVFCPQALVIYADSGQVEQVLMNLATNARDAMPQGGRFVVETDRVVFNAADIRSHGIGDPGVYAVVTVTDTGVGMDEATQKRIFDPFFTTKEVGRGTGLGLAIVYGIIKQHHGYINVYSEPGKGTTFRIYFPLLSIDKEQRSKMPATPAEVRGGTETLLLAEDDDGLRKLAKQILEEFGYTVIDAKNGEEAIELYEKNREKISLLLLDMIMPKKSGKEAYDAISRLSPGIKVVFVSGYTADKIYTDGLITPGTDLLLKPLTPRELAKKVRDVLDRAAPTMPPAGK